MPRINPYKQYIEDKKKKEAQERGTVYRQKAVEKAKSQVNTGTRMVSSTQKNVVPQATFDPNVWRASQVKWDEYNAIKADAYKQIDDYAKKNNINLSEKDKRLFFEQQMRASGKGAMMDTIPYVEIESQKFIEAKDEYERLLAAAPKEISDFVQDKTPKPSHAFLAYMLKDPKNAGEWIKKLTDAQKEYSFASENFAALKRTKDQYARDKKVNSSSESQAQAGLDSATEELKQAKKSFMLDNPKYMSPFMAAQLYAASRKDEGILAAQKKVQEAEQFKWDVSKVRDFEKVITSYADIKESGEDISGFVEKGSAELLKVLGKRAYTGDAGETEKINARLDGLLQKASFIQKDIELNPNDESLKQQKEKIYDEIAGIQTELKEKTLSESQYSLLQQNPELFEAYAYYVGKNGLDEKTKDFLIRDLNRQGIEIAVEDIKELYKDDPLGAGAYASVAKITSGMAGSVANARQVIKNAATGEYEPVDLYQNAYAPQHYVNTATEMATKDLTEIQKYFANLAISAPQQVVTIALGGVPGAVSMGLSAAGDASFNALQSGASPEEALAYSVAVGSATAVFEKIGIDNILASAGRMSGKTAKEIAKSFFKSTGVTGMVEGLEEMAEEVSNIIADIAILKDKGQVAMYMKEYVDNNPYKSQGQVKLAAVINALGQVAQAGASGAIMGSVIGAGNIAANLGEVYQNAEAARSYGNMYFEAVSANRETDINREAWRLVVGGLAENPKTEGYKLAEKLSTKETLDEYDLGLLASVDDGKLQMNANALAAESFNLTQKDILGAIEKGVEIKTPTLDRLAKSNAKVLQDQKVKAMLRVAPFNLIGNQGGIQNEGLRSGIQREGLQDRIEQGQSIFGTTEENTTTRADREAYTNSAKNIREIEVDSDAGKIKVSEIEVEESDDSQFAVEVRAAKKAASDVGLNLHLYKGTVEGIEGTQGFINGKDVYVQADAQNHFYDIMLHEKFHAYASSNSETFGMFKNATINAMTDEERTEILDIYAAMYATEIDGMDDAQREAYLMEEFLADVYSGMYLSNPKSLASMEVGDVVFDSLKSNVEGAEIDASNVQFAASKYDTEAVRIANATSRSAGCVGPNAITPKYVMDTSDTNETILDFGAGKTAAHTQLLRYNGFQNVTAYDFGENIGEHHDADALSKKYDTVFASNVLNVSSTEDMLQKTITEIRDSVKDGGRAVFNYPSSPRKAGLSAAAVKSIVQEVFNSEPILVGGTNSVPLWEVWVGINNIRYSKYAYNSEAEKIYKQTSGMVVSQDVVNKQRRAKSFQDAWGSVVRAAQDTFYDVIKFGESLGDESIRDYAHTARTGAYATEFAVGHSKTKHETYFPDMNGGKIGESLHFIFNKIYGYAEYLAKKAEPTDKKAYEQERRVVLDKFYDYLFHSHNVDRMSVVQNILTEINTLENENPELAKMPQSVLDKISKGEQLMPDDIDAMSKQQVDKRRVFGQYVDLLEKMDKILKTFPGIKKMSVKSIQEMIGEKNTRTDKALKRYIDLLTEANKIKSRYKALNKLPRKIIEDIAGKIDAKERAVIQKYRHLLEVYSNAHDKPVFDSRFTAEDSKKVVAEAEKMFPGFAALAEEVYGYGRNLLKIQVESQLISQELADMLMQKYPHYIPIKIVKDGETYTPLPTTDTTGVKETVHYAEGNTGTGMLYPNIALSERTAEVFREAYKNRLFTRMLRAHEESGANNKYILSVSRIGKDGDIDIETETDARNKIKLQGNKVTGFENGSSVELTVSNGIFEGFMELSNPIPVKKWMSLPADIFKKLITSWNPVFAYITNPIKDIADAFIYNKYGVDFRKYLKRAFKEMRENSPDWQRYQAGGAFASSIYDSQRGFNERSGTSRINKYSALSLAIEQFPRFATYLIVMDKSGGDRYSEEVQMRARREAADITTNFITKGRFTAVLNKTVVPFLNPNIQGFEHFQRAFKSSKGKALASLLVRAAIWGVGPSLLFELLYWDDDEYNRFDDETKDKNYLIRIAGKWIAIPKGRVASLFGNPVQRVLREARGNKQNWGEMARVMVDQVGPANPVTQNIFTGLIQIGTNTAWHGGKIVNDTLSESSPELQYDEKTSEIAKAIGGFFKISPKYVDYFINQYGGIIGDILLPITTGTKGKSSGEIAWTAVSAFLKRFEKDPDINSKTSDMYYEAREDDARAAADEDAIRPEEKDLKTVNSLMFSFSESQATVIKDINAHIRKVLNNNNLPGGVKDKVVDALVESRNIAQQIILAGREKLRPELEKTYDEMVDVDAIPYIRNAQAELAYTDALRKVYSSESVLKMRDKDAYERAGKAQTLGTDMDTYYEYYRATRTDTGVATTEKQRKTILSGLDIGEDNIKNIFIAEFEDKDTKPENSIAYAVSNDVSAATFAAYSGTDFGEEKGASVRRKEWLVKNTSSDKELATMYNMFFESDATKEENSIGYAMSLGISPADFINRGLQKAEEKGTPDTGVDLQYIGGTVEEKLTETTVSGSLKTESMTNLINSKLSDNDKIFFYQKEYPSDDKFVWSMLADIPVDEYLKMQRDWPSAVGETKDGKTVSGSLKKARIELIDSLDLSEGQKALLIAQQYKLDDYSVLYDYINGLSLSSKERSGLLNSLGLLEKSSGSGGGSSSQKVEKEPSIRFPAYEGASVSASSQPMSKLSASAQAGQIEVDAVGLYKRALQRKKESQSDYIRRILQRGKL